ncbi:MAG TPA: hypothetical protein VK400_18570 [Pyrinomonadaceae bacterium]|nr:hypothetical protein [Pyrinomonadaceae bacterium]
MNTLDFEIIPSPSSNDHQIRFLVDGADWLGDRYLGIDPPAFFALNDLVSGDGRLLIGRCRCGCPGCDDYFVNVERTEFKVGWVSPDRKPVEFIKEKYDSVISAARADTSWEDTNRTAERMISQVFIDASTRDGYKFEWASARVTPKTMTLSFSRNGVQKLFKFRWDEKSVEDALISARQSYSEITGQGAPGAKTGKNGS